MSSEGNGTPGNPDLIVAYLELLRERCAEPKDEQLQKAEQLGAKLAKDPKPGSTMASWQAAALAKLLGPESNIELPRALELVDALHTAAAHGFDTAYQEKAAQISLVEEQVVRSQRMEAIGQLAGGVAHDFNNLLTVILSFARFVHDDMAPGDPRREDITEVLRAADSAARLTSQLLSFSKRRPVEPSVIDLYKSVVMADKMLQRTLGSAVEHVVLPIDQTCHVRMDSSQLDQLVLNLAVNARDAMPQGGTLTFSIRIENLRARHELEAGEYVVLQVEDTGIGMSPEIMSRIFEPFFTTKSSGGTGLGLSTCYGIVKQAGGLLSVASTVGEGTTFTIYLPRTKGDEKRTNEMPRSSRRPRDTLRPLDAGQVLLVEDQPALRRMMLRTLRRAGYEVIEARSAEEALSLCDERFEELDAVLTDVMLPGLSGTELVSRLRVEQPELPALLTSGYVSEEYGFTINRDTQTAFMPKPFTGKQLLARLKALLL